MTSSRHDSPPSEPAVIVSGVPRSRVAGGPAGLVSAAFMICFTWLRIEGRYG